MYKNDQFLGRLSLYSGIESIIFTLLAAHSEQTKPLNLMSEGSPQGFDGAQVCYTGWYQRLRMCR